ncbi:MAG: hypothetical protein AAFO95_07730 [Cyanobacteria bacterium J06600_6]
MNKLERQARVLAIAQAKPAETAELKEYSRNQFQLWRGDGKNLPLQDEPHLPVWQEYRDEARAIGVEQALKQRLVQLNFAIAPGTSQTPAYKEATKKGRWEISSQAGVEFEAELELNIQSTIAGKIPVIIARSRSDFVSLIQALTKKNEPEPIPNSMGACIVGGYNNWDRIHRYRQNWSDRTAPQNTEADWQAEFKRLIPQKQLYQDRFIILSHGSYSNVNAADLGLEPDIWQELSLKIRLEHECTHYLTRRLLGLMQNNILDELIADYQGIIAANGSYRADWFLHFLGLAGDEYREGGRLANYRGVPPLSAGAFKVLQTLMRQVAFNLESFDRQYYQGRDRNQQEKLAVFLALTSSTILDLAAADGVEMLTKKAIKASNQHLKS